MSSTNCFLYFYCMSMNAKKRTMAMGGMRTSGGHPEGRACEPVGAQLHRLQGAAWRVWRPNVRLGDHAVDGRTGGRAQAGVGGWQANR